jgi:hypothetical protein
MKNKFFLLVKAITTITLGMLMLACSSAPKADVFDDLFDPAVSVAEHAVLTIDEDYRIGSIDGVLASFPRSKERRLMLPPGEHTLTFIYANLTRSESSYTTGRTTTTISRSQLTMSDEMEISGTFLPGHFYRLGIDYNSSTTNVVSVTDETDPTIYTEKRLQRAAQKRNEAVQKELLAVADSPREIVVSREPTKFEGTWIRSDQFMTYIFSGNTVTSISGANIVTKGTFEFTDNILILHYRLWTGTLEYDYSFNHDGTLSFQGGVFSKTEN